MFHILKKHTTVPIVAAISFLILTLLTAGNYGIYGDELYYFVCAKHLDWGYVDHPPSVAFLTLISTWIFGETVIGLRLLSGLAGAITVLLSAKIAGTMGGGKFSQSFAALSICFASAFPALSSFFSMNAVDIMLCALFIYFLMKTIIDPSPHKWILLGILFGAGLLNKYTFFVLGFSLVISLIITKRWNIFKSPWIYLSGAIGFLMFLPHIIWQINHDWPTLEFMYNATEYKNLSLSPIEFFTQIVIGLNPFTLPLWLGGLMFLLFNKTTKEFRYLGWIAIVFLLVYLFQNSKFYYVLPIFPLLLSAGSVALERISLNYRIGWLRWVTGSTIVISGIILLPLATPILPAKQFVYYAKFLGLWDAVRMEKEEGDTLPLHFVFRFGWEELVAELNKVYDELPQPEKEKCAILASWYGIAGAIDHYGEKYELPNAICPRNNYWFWGTRNYSGEVILAVGYDMNFLKRYFNSVERMAYFKNTYAYDVEIYLCKEPKLSLDQMWLRLKNFI